MTEPLAAGAQHWIAGGGYQACMASVGASLRVLTLDGVDLIEPFDEAQPRPSMHGALLAPWPNRLADGRYGWRGREHRVPVNEPERGTANHGLVADLDFALHAQAPDSVALRARLAASDGYPWPLTLTVEASVSERGLLHRVEVRNEGATPAPLGLGVHPYLLGGSGAADTWTLTLPAGRVMHVSEDRMLPERIVPVAGGSLDFCAPRDVGATVLNHGFTDLPRDRQGWAWARLTGPGGSGVEIGLDAAYRWLQAYTADHADPARTAIALEPMTCPADALGTGTDVLTLAPGAVQRASFTLRGVGPRVAA